MFAVLCALQYVLCKGDSRIFFESQYDPLVKDAKKTPSSKFKALSELTGFFGDHNNHIPSSIETFGDLNILSINFYKEILVVDKIEETMNELIDFMDHIHPSIVAVQGITKDELTYLTQFIDSEEHYKIANTEKGLVDYITGAKTYLPIIYDAKMFSVEKADYFSTSEKEPQPFGSYIVVKDNRLPNAKVAFTLINIDLYSSFSEVVSAEFFSIIDDVANAKDIKDAPVFLVGNLGTMPMNVQEAIDLSYNDLIKEDRNNQKLSKTTEHTKNNDDNIERSFILLKDLKKEMKVNYARILSEYKAGDHYPLHAILTLTHSIADMKEAKKNVDDDKKEDVEKADEKSEGDNKKEKAGKPEAKNEEDNKKDGSDVNTGKPEANKPAETTNPNAAKPNTNPEPKTAPQNAKPEQKPSPQNAKPEQKPSPQATNPQQNVNTQNAKPTNKK
ncbi:hypothetical protein BDAP_002093 [Binucleata daphniae]